MLKEEANKGLKKEEVFVAGDGNASVKTETSSFDNATEFENSTDVETIKCPDCGSNMVFDPTKQDLFCEHCGRVESFEKNREIKEIDIEKGFLEARTWDEEACVFSCENCGAKVVLGKSETANVCPFCGTARVIKTEELAGIRPNVVFPFLKSIEQASYACINWVRRKFFAPRKFKKTATPHSIKGVYIPTFTFDSKTCSTYFGRIGKRHVRTVGSGKNRRTETYIVWRNISGTHNSFFDDVSITAGNKLEQKKLDKILPFNQKSACVYEDKYLYGFMAYHYEKDIKQCWGEAKVRIDSLLRAQILSRYVYDVVDYLNVSTVHQGVTYKYVMLPVYMGIFRHKNKNYNFYVNGSTGKVIGKTPVSPIKVGVLTLIIAGLIALGVWLFTILG